MAEENNETKIPQGQNGHESAVIPPIYATNLLGGKRLFLRSSEHISSLQIMAEENNETKIPQGQNGHESAVIPPRMNQKTKWPEVVGLTVEEAERIIKEEKPGVQIQVLPPNRVYTFDYKVQRVRLHVDSSGKVHRPPIIG
ncbi:subtilisin-chymotrypsin inhibitor CI-1A-like [Rhododendron vialii]|uniref:subtilisin-chymotrypsin inhibitor CI-1A-like n=1 Tax=Rhododendron vialii TaxID=182163 RepID=UPI00265F155E|nr:subtilisin-chymotrypsin inhibitor CI-1A-like [Rhododendron vialii]